MSAASGFGATWQFSDVAGSSTFHDTSGNGNTGHIGAGMSLSGSYSRFSGRGNGTVPSSSTLNPGRRDFRWATKVMRTGGYAAPNLVQKGEYGDHPASQYKMEYHDGTATCRVIGSNGHRTVGLRVNLNDGFWHTISCTKHAFTLTINVDGRVLSHGGANVGSITNDKPLTIGGKASCPSGNCDRLTGYMDWVTVSLV